MLALEAAALEASKDAGLLRCTARLDGLNAIWQSLLMQKTHAILWSVCAFWPVDSLADGSSRVIAPDAAVDVWPPVNNAAYLTFAHERCNLYVGTMINRYRSRAVAAGLTPERANSMIEELVEYARPRDGQNWTDFGNDFCTEAIKSFPTFVKDLNGVIE